AVPSARVGADDQRGGGDDGAGPDKLEEVGSPRLYQFLDPGLVGFSLRTQVTDPAGEAAHRLSGAGDRGVAGRPPAGADGDDLSGALASEALGEGFGAGGGEGHELAFGVAGHLDGRASCDEQGCDGVSVAGVAGRGQVVAAEG